MVLLFGTSAVLAIDESDLLKDLLNKDQQEQLRKQIDSSKKSKKDNGRLKPKTRQEIVWKDGIKSEVDLKCLEQQNKKNEFRVKVKMLKKWLDKCRPKKLGSCKVKKREIDKVCMARIQSFYEFEFTPKEEKILESKCSRSNLTCAIVKAE